VSNRRAFADAVRKAGLAFVRGVALGWDETDLERWRRERYAKLASKPTDVFHMTPVRSSVEAIIPRMSDVLREARWKVFAALDEAAHGNTRFIQQVAREKLIARDETLGWVPVDRRGAVLRGRVLSLFAVDALYRPSDYRTILLACPRCESVVFDLEARRAGQCCGEESIQSGIQEVPPSRMTEPRRETPGKERKH